MFQLNSKKDTMKNTIFQIELTNYCNGNCPWCLNSELKRKKGFMSMEMVEDIIETMKGRQNYVLLHFYGESLLHPNFSEIVNNLKLNKIQSGVHTNGSLLSKVDTACLRNVMVTVNRFKPFEEIKKLLKNGNIEALFIDIKDDELNVEKFNKWCEENTVKHRLLKYDNPEMVNGKRECCLRDCNNECLLRQENAYSVLWDGRVVTCVKDSEAEGCIGTYKELDKFKYKNNLCPFI